MRMSCERVWYRCIRYITRRRRIMSRVEAMRVKGGVMREYVIN
jgi:hypothetical protein